MLVITRKQGEKFVIGDNIIITIVEVDRGRVRIAIEAPGLPIYREEILPEGHPAREKS